MNHLDEGGQCQGAPEHGGEQEHRLSYADRSLVDEPFRYEAVKRWNAGNRQRRYEARDKCHRHRFRKAAQLFKLGCPGALFDCTGAEEKTAFIKCVVQHVEQSPDKSDGKARTDTHDHVAHLADRMERQEFFQVVLDKGHHDREYDRNAADYHQKHHGAVTQREHVKRYARKKVDAEKLVETGGQKRHDTRRSAFGRPGYPCMPRHRTRLDKRRNEQKDIYGRFQTVDHGNGVERADPNGPPHLPYHYHAEHKGAVGKSDHDKGLAGGFLRLISPHRYHVEQERRRYLPRNEQDHQVIGKDRHRGRTRRPEYIGIILVQAFAPFHESDGINNDKSGKDFDCQKNEGTQRVGAKIGGERETAYPEPHDRQ